MEPPETLFGLPALAGLATFEQALRPGLSVAACVQQLKIYHYALRRTHEILLARLAAEPIYELKMAFSLHAFYCAEHISTLRTRVAEMREPPLGLEAVPDERLALVFDEIRSAPTAAMFIVGLHLHALSWLAHRMQVHIDTTNPLADAPTVRVLKFALIEINEMVSYGQKAVDGLLSQVPQPLDSTWFDLLKSTLDGISSEAHATEGEKANSPVPSRRFSVEPARYDPRPQRDARFSDPYNMGVNAEAFLYDPMLPPEPKVLMMFYKRLREIDVPEVMASIVSETPDKPWGYYRDMTRQLWDEARHAMMGEVGFRSLGLDWAQHVRVNFTWSLGLNTQLSARERHGVLYFIEQGLMPKTGKRYEWETAQAAGHPLAALFQDYDWADEVLHARIGRDWYVSTFENPKEATEWGDQCWSKVVVGWSQWRDEGLTEHHNWWPDLYREYCSVRGVEPIPDVLSFATSYETQRADLKVLSGAA